MDSTTSDALRELETIVIYPLIGPQPTKEFLPHQFELLKALMLAEHSIMLLLCASLLGYMRYHRTIALRGDATAARKLILPSFEPFVWIIAGVSNVFTVILIIDSLLKIYPMSFPPVLGETFYSERQFVFASVIVLMLQRSVSPRALCNTILISFGLATYTVPIRWFMAYHGQFAHMTLVMTFARLVVLLFYTYALIYPPSRASSRTIRQYCLFVYGFFALLFANSELFSYGFQSTGYVLAVVTVLWASLCPLAIWRVLRADTEHWRGFGDRAVTLQTLFRQQYNLMDEYVSSQGLHVLIEMHSSLMIDFAYLEVRRRIGVGATAVVFNGLLKSKTPIAIKVYTPPHFDEDMVAGISHEAALCGALRHPNIVMFHGMCISPPTICLVYELCLGSLEDIMMTIERQVQRDRRQTLLIQLGYMLDAARAVAYLHSFSPQFLHRDLKSANFVVDVNGTVKLTDFGESRSVPREATVRQLSDDNGLQHSNPADDKHGDYSPPSEGQQGTHDWADRSMTVCGTVDYMAPEVINGRAGRAEYGAAADVYSLAITFWDILHPGEKKYPMIQNNHMKIFEHVLDGERPTIASHVHPVLRELLELTWKHERDQRPTMQTIVTILERLQEETHAALAQELRGRLIPSLEFVSEWEVLAPLERSFTGTQLTSVMIYEGLTASTGEAIRLGNAFMDAGLLHHLHHACAFANSDTIYYFDDESILLNQPLGLKHSKSGGFHAQFNADSDDAEADGSEVDFSLVLTPNAHPCRRAEGTSFSDADAYISHSPVNWARAGHCGCRQLGQRLTLPRKSSWRRRRDRSKISISTEIPTQMSVSSSLDGIEIFGAVGDEYASIDQVVIGVTSE